MVLSFSQKGRQLQIKFGRNADSTEPAELELPQSLCYKNTMKLTREEIQRIAALARLRLTAEEEEHLTEQLDRILQYMDKLNEVDTSKVEPLAHVIDIVNGFREDRVTNQPNPDAVLGNAPAKDQTFFQVPKIIE
jgi:aspartyl-tRNA(Asn)/glutamyl-tRNA(Gln) amidotransferase subunit C